MPKLSPLKSQATRVLPLTFFLLELVIEVLQFSLALQLSPLLQGVLELPP